MMRKITAFLSAALLSLSLSSCKMTETPTKETKHSIAVPPKMVFLGDSIAAGYGLEGYTDTDNYNCRSYSNILKEKYETELKDECGHTMINKAVSGATSEDLIELIQSGDLDSDLRDSDAVVISIGGNDLLGILFKVMENMGVTDVGSFDADNFDLKEAAASLLTMNGDIDKALKQFDANIKIIAEELDKRTDGTVYVQTLYDPLEYFNNISMVTDLSSDKIGKLNSIISDNASSGYTVINVADDFKGKAGELTNISSLDIHPNAEGHVAIAKAVDEAFRETGFSYTTTEEGSPKLTKQAVIAIGIGILGSAAVLCLIIVMVRTENKKNKKDE
jgi:lysophospholipase L1-like esterase